MVCKATLTWYSEGTGACIVKFLLGVRIMVKKGGFRSVVLLSFFNGI